MIKGKRGGLFMAMILGGFIFMIGMLHLPFVKDGVTDFRTNIQCTNSSITDGAKLLCLGGDIVVPYFIITLLAFIGGLIGYEL